MADINQYFGPRIEQRNPLPFEAASDCKNAPGPSSALAGNSAAITLLRSQIRRVAPYFRTALLTGEYGCGDIAVAHALHDLSPLHDRAFLELTTAETKLWLSGGSASASIATAGMIYLPQPDRLERSEQHALLRLLHTRGSHSPRVVAYAEHGLRPLVSSNGFLAELASTLGSLRITLPPLRERAEDIPLLLAEMLSQHGSGVSIAAASLFETAMAQPWPGNLDQLLNVVNRMLDRRISEVLEESDLLTALESFPEQAHDRRAVRLVPLEQVTQEHIRSVLFACGGNKLRAADILGISRSTLYRMLDAPIPCSQAEIPDRMLMAG